MCFCRDCQDGLRSDLTVAKMENKLKCVLSVLVLYLYDPQESF